MGYWQSLTGRLFKRVFGGYVVLTILVTMVQLALEYASVHQTIGRDIDALGKSFNGGVAGAMWELDRSLLKTIAQGIAQSSIVTGVRISSREGATYASIGEVPAVGFTNSEGILAPFQVSATRLLRTTPTGTRELGQLTIYANRSVAVDRVKYSFMVILINSMIKTAGLWLIFYLVISRSLSRPLSQLTQIVSHVEFVADSNETISLDYPHQDELGRLMGAMGTMQKRLFAARSELENVNLHLEETVAERTRNLADALAFNETILLNSPIPVGVYAANGQCVLANDAYAKFVGATRQDLLKQNFHHIAAWQKTSLLGDCLTALAHHTPQQREANARTSFGKDVWFEYQIIPTHLKGEDHLLIQFFDLTERKRMEEELRHIAFHDALTQLPNRRLLIDRLKRAILVSKRQNTYGAVLFLDLDKFKLLNDTHGHDIGDLLLVEVAQRLQRVVRDCDTVARLGGDEFVVLLEGLGTAPTEATERAMAVTQKIIEALGSEYVLGHVRHHGSASVGLKLFNGDESDADQILKEADVAMYEAKKKAASSFAATG
ncbi:MAG: diguanylate cyclase [Rhodoferax sp.]|nr:diguanylate cyclase [Rhodoferax sp.]